MDTANPQPPSSKTKSPTKPFVLRVKPEGAEKWKTLGYLNMRTDQSGGVATLFLADGTKLEKVSIFPHEKKKADGDADGDAAE